MGTRPKIAIGVENLRDTLANASLVGSETRKQVRILPPPTWRIIMKKYTKIINTLRKLEALWDTDLMLFAYDGSLELVRRDNMEIIESFSICCDGGDPGIIDDGNKKYLDLEE